MGNSDQKKEKLDYYFGSIQEFNLQEIENEILRDSGYLDVFAGSDSNFKTELESFESPLKTLKQLQGIKFKYDSEKYPLFDDNNQTAGLIAQDVEKVLPAAVKMDSEGLKYVQYPALNALFVEAIKELEAIVHKQQEMIKELESKIQ